MTGQEVIEQSARIAEEINSQLSNRLIPQNKRQVYFMDMYPKVQGCMKALKSIIQEIKNADTASNASADKMEMMEDANKVLTVLQGTISSFQQELMINENIDEDDIEKVSGLNSDTLQEAVQNNDTTKEIMKDMDNIAKNSAANIGYTHCLVCDGVMNMFNANTKEELNKNINDIAAAGNYKQFNLFRVSFIPIPLKKKTILATD